MLTDALQKEHYRLLWTRHRHTGRLEDTRVALWIYSLRSLSRHTICSHIGAVPPYVELCIIFDAGGASPSTGKSANITVYAHIKLMISLALGSLPLDSFIVVQARLIASYTMWDTRNVVTLIIWHAHPAVDLGVSGAWG